ncbi:MAG: hypothetical protein NC131_06285 [Roseburia sp.]|nr:hypothetical protein [Roseburia sp.]
MTAGREAVGRYVMQPINDFTAIDEVTDITTSELNKLWRAKILLDRVTHPAKQGSSKNTLPAEAKAHTKNVKATPTNAQYNQDGGGTLPESSFSVKANKANREAVVLNKETQDKAGSVSFVEDKTPLEERKAKYDKRLAASLNKKRIQIFNMSVDPVMYLELQTYPEKVSFQGESTWAVINSMGRNTPMYHFTGAESIIQMNITWYCDDPANPADVITKCKLLEAWSKGNGYISAPPILKLNWGDSELFRDELFILTAATYELSNWRGSAKQYDRQTKDLSLRPGYVDTNLLPAMATQELIFRRVSATNLTHNDIVSSDLVNKTKGINKAQ